MTFLHTVVAMFLVVVTCRAQNETTKKPQIYSMHIESDITYRFATTKVSSRVKNPGNQSREAKFDVTLPNEAFITNLTIEIDGKITVGEIKEKEVAKAEYAAAKKRDESAGYIGTKYRETNKFVLAVNVAPLSKISFILTYQELLRRKLGFYEQEIYVNPGQPVEDLVVTVSILESREITRLTVPPIRNDVGDPVSDVDNSLLIDRPTNQSAFISYTPSISQQILQSEKGLAGRFLVQYDVERALDKGDVMLVNGYFVHFFAPEGLQPIPNDVLFILDVSGSMSGTKLAQLKSAMQSNLRQLSPGDRFNIMTFSGIVKTWRKSMADVDDEDAMENAKDFVRSLEAKGWTNINNALTRGIALLEGQKSTSNQTRSPIIMFLTDGEPTQGETDPDKILKTVTRVNEGNIPVFTLAFGDGADWEFVKKLALQNDGFGRKIYEASDAAQQIMGIFNEISVTLLSNITFNYLDAQAQDVTKSRFSQYFNGSEVVVCGFLSSKPEVIDVEVTFETVSGESQIILSGVENILGIPEGKAETKNYEEITEKVWAYLTIKQLLEKMTATENSEEKENYKEEILKLSLKYSFVTPLTSMVVTENNKISSENIGQFLGENIEREQVKGHSIGQNAPFNRGMLAFDNHMISGIRPASGHSFRQVLHMPPRIPYGNPKKMIAVPQSAVIYQQRRKTRQKQNQRKQIRKQTKKHRKQRKNQKRSFPLLVDYRNMPYKVCYTLYDPELEKRNVKYLFFDNNDVQINILLSSNAAVDSRGAIRSLEIISPDAKLELNSASTLSDLQTDSSYFSITSKTESEVIIEVDQTQFQVYYSELNREFSFGVKDNNSIKGTSGILGQILKPDIEVVRVHKKKNKANVILRIGRKKYPTKERSLSSDLGPSNSCLTIRRGESRLYSMAVELVA